MSPYGISKAAEGLLAIGYHTVHNLPVAVAVPFNLIGPGLPESFVSSRIVRQAMEIVNGERSAIDLRGLDSRRDFVDVRDAVAAYWQIVSADGYEERIAGAKINVRLGDRSLDHGRTGPCSTVPWGRVDVQPAAQSLPDPIPAQTADITRDQERDFVGWSPRIPLETSIRDMLAHSKVG